MTKEEKKQIAELIKKEQHEIKELKEWSASLKHIIVEKDRDVLDQFEAYKYQKDCDNVIAAKESQLVAYMNIAKNLNKPKEEDKK